MPAPTTSGRSAHGTGPYGAMLGWSLPAKVGTCPPTSAFEAWLTSIETADSSRPTSTRRGWRESSPASAPTAAYRPVTTSATATPTLVGSLVPVTDIRPLRACAMTS